jgi:hypothetical protein
MFKLKTKQIAKGRVINFSDDGQIFVGQNYTIAKYNLQGGYTPIAKVPCSFKRKMIEPCRLICRFLRHEIRGFVQLDTGEKIAATRQGLYYSGEQDYVLKPALLPKTHLEIKPPMAMTVDSAGRILWGEYWSNRERREVRLFVSEDKGKTYEPFHTFKAGEVKHIHHILEDSFDNCYWVCAGDHNSEPGIGKLSRDLKYFDWLVKGKQQYRAVTGFVFKDKIVYGTDTEKDFNAIYVLNKNNGYVEKLCETPGSCIYAAKFGKWYAISTSVEYFEKHNNDTSTVWISEDTLNWHEVYQAKKDIWSMKYFQFGSIVLPRGGWEYDKIVFSGQALKGIDNRVYIAEVIEE